MKLLVISTSVGSDISYFYKQTELTMITQLLKELPDLGMLCLPKCLKGSLWCTWLKKKIILLIVRLVVC